MGASARQTLGNGTSHRFKTPPVSSVPVPSPRVPVVLAFLLCLPLLAGCLSTDAPAAVAPGRDVGLDPATRPALVPPTFLEPVELGTAMRTLDAGVSPVVGVSPNGTVYVGITGGFWRSDDLGMTFQPLGEKRCGAPMPCSTTNPGTRGLFDGVLAVGPDETVHWLSTGDLSGFSLPYQRSVDKGETWSDVADLDPGNNTGSPWLSVDDDGVLYAAWRETSWEEDDCITLLGTCYVRPDATANESRVVTHSSNGVDWFSSAIPGGGILGPVATDPASPAVYLPSAARDLTVWRSVDHGTTWNETLVRPGIGTLVQYPVAAVDAAGAVYVAWAEDPSAPADPGTPVGFAVPRLAGIPHVYLAVSRDGGATFSEPRMLSSPDRPALFPWVVAGDAGRVAVAWYDGVLPLPSDHVPNQWNVAVAMSVLADQPEPVFETFLATPRPIHLGSICTTGAFCYAPVADQTMGLFFQMALLPDGSPVLAFAGDADVKMATVKVYATRMTEGTKLRG